MQAPGGTFLTRRGCTQFDRYFFIMVGAGDGPQYTFWSYLRDRWTRDVGLRIDHLLLSSSLAERLQEAGVDREVRGRANASDHAPVWAIPKDGGRRVS